MEKPLSLLQDFKQSCAVLIAFIPPSAFLSACLSAHTEAPVPFLAGNHTLHRPLTDLPFLNLESRPIHSMCISANFSDIICHKCCLWSSDFQIQQRIVQRLFLYTPVPYPLLPMTLQQDDQTNK